VLQAINIDEGLVIHFITEFQDIGGNLPFAGTDQEDHIDDSRSSIPVSTPVCQDYGNGFQRIEDYAYKLPKVPGSTFYISKAIWEKGRPDPLNGYSPLQSLPKKMDPPFSVDKKRERLQNSPVLGQVEFAQFFVEGVGELPDDMTLDMTLDIYRTMVRSETFIPQKARAPETYHVYVRMTAMTSKTSAEMPQFKNNFADRVVTEVYAYNTGWSEDDDKPTTLFYHFGNSTHVAFPFEIAVDRLKKANPACSLLKIEVGTVPSNATMEWDSRAHTRQVARVKGIARKNQSTESVLHAYVG
jgi:hypothetical protein